jgi:hypothetical protein
VAYGIVYEFKGVDKQQYDAVNEKLGIDIAGGTGEWPAGLTSHAAGTATDGGFFVMEVWDSKAQQEAWMAGRLGEALGAIGVPAPVRVSELDIAGYATP